MSNITVNEIESLFKLIIEKLKIDKLHKLELNFNEYWIVSSDEWTSFEEVPKPVVGSLEEDVEYLKKAIEENAIYSYSNFDRLATILRAISEKQAPVS